MDRIVWNQYLPAVLIFKLYTGVPHAYVLVGVGTWVRLNGDVNHILAYPYGDWGCSQMSECAQYWNAIFFCIAIVPNVLIVYQGPYRAVRGVSTQGFHGSCPQECTVQQKTDIYEWSNSSCDSFVARGEHGGRAPALGLVCAFCACGQWLTLGQA